MDSDSEPDALQRGSGRAPNRHRYKKVSQRIDEVRTCATALVHAAGRIQRSAAPLPAVNTALLPPGRLAQPQRHCSAHAAIYTFPDVFGIEQAA